MSPLVWAEIDLGNLRRNLKVIRSLLANRRTEILAVVKADAYGHGMERIARVLYDEGVRFFGVANIEEAAQLRAVCRRARILVLGSFREDQLPHYIRHRICPTVSSLEDVRHLVKALGPAALLFPVHVKIDTGMGRLGVWHEDAPHFFQKILLHHGLIVEGVYTHFSRADHADRAFTERQLELFDASVRAIRSLGFSPKYFHAANSLGLVRFKKSHFNLVRPGILLYGIHPGPGPAPAGIRPILSLKTRIAFLKEVRKGRAFSYGATHTAGRDTRVATLPIGYSHGYRVGFSNKAFVVIRGHKCPVIGRVTMDQTLVDVGHVPAVRRWDEVTVIGSEGRSQVSAADLAAISQTIPYEIVCSIHSRIPRVYKDI